MTETQRVFFALWPDPLAIDQLSQVVESAGTACGGRAMRRETLHLTLAFIGAATPGQVEALIGVAAQVRAAPCDIRLDHLGLWPHNRILWAGCREVPSCQRRLFAILAHHLAAAGFAVEQRPFFPHVTLRRSARCNVLPVLAEPISWRAATFRLVASELSAQGARYRTLGQWPLDDSD